MYFSVAGPAAATTSDVQVGVADNPSPSDASVVQDMNDYRRTSLDVLPFYHARPIVPIPPGMEPIPALRQTRAPHFPAPDVGTPSRRAWYLCSVGVNPGIKWTTWADFCPNIEAYRGLPAPYSPVFRRVDGPLPSAITSIRVLPPPPRPSVELVGVVHVWVVYVGRVPGVYYSLYVLIACIRVADY